MGFNICGVLVDHNYASQPEALFRQLGWSVLPAGEVDFETASSNYKEPGYADAYFTASGTLLFVSMGRIEEVSPIAGRRMMSFLIGETADVYKLEYYEGLVLRRGLLEADGELMDDDGAALPGEIAGEEVHETLYRIFADILGERFDDMNWEGTISRYRFKT